MTARPSQTFSNVKDPEAKLYYGFDVSEWVVSGDTLATATWTVPSGITKVSEGIVDDTLAVVRLSGGTAGTVYPCVCHWTTTPTGDIDDRTLMIVCKER